MPTEILGYSRNEVVAILQDMIGNTSASLQNAIRTGISAWQMEFINMHDWSFTHNIPRCNPEPRLYTIPGQRCYSLSFGAQVVWSNNVESIVCLTPGGERKLIATTMQDARINDPGGISTGRPTFWFPLNMEEIELWPVPDREEEFVVEGKFEPSFISGNATDYALDIPYKYQDCFVQFCFVKALRRERDPRAKEEMMFFKEQLRIAITEDMRNLDSNLRMKTTNEQFVGANTFDLNFALWNYWN